MMTPLDRAARDTRGVHNPVCKLLALSAQIEMILQQHAQQLTTISLKLQLQLGVLQPPASLRPKPPDDLPKPLAGALEPILDRADPPVHGPPRPQDPLHQPTVRTAGLHQPARKVRRNGCRGRRSSLATSKWSTLI
jgi:hypothetical protein